MLVTAVTAACGQPAGQQDTAAPTTSPAEVLQRFRTATGGDAWDRVEAIELDATISFGGLSGTFHVVEDVAGGRSRSRVALGPIVEVEGWDGAAGWTVSPGGDLVVADTGPPLAEARTHAWLARRGFFRADGARFVDHGRRRDGASAFRVIEATPDGGIPIELWFDDHGLLARTVEKIGSDTVTTFLSDYRAAGDVRIPFEMILDQGGPDTRATVTVTAARRTASPPPAAFTAPRTEAPLELAGGATRTEIPFELINNHVFISANVDGAAVRMLVDTGGNMVLTPAAARRLALTVEGELTTSGAGADKAKLGFARAGRLTLGAASLPDPLFYVIDTGRLADVEGEDFDGVVGFALFSRAPVRIDYPRRVLVLTAPEAFTPPAGAIAVPFQLHDQKPVVAGTIDGVPGTFWIDTGSRLSLTIMAPFTRTHALVAKYRPAFETIVGWGIGGAVRSSPVRFREVTIGGAVIPDVVGDLFTGTAGAFTDPDAAGNLGGGVLRRFAVTFDYAARVLYLEPGPEAGRRDVYDRSGMFLLRDGEAARVEAVTPDGPAARAGVVAGDRILAIDGAAFSTRPLAAWRDLLRERPPGTRLRLRLARGEVTLTLAELVR